MNGTICVLLVSTLFISSGNEELIKSETIPVDETLCRVVKKMTGKEFGSGDSLIRKTMSCECSLPDKNAVMIPTFVGQSKSIVRYKKY